jgi:hypothetical protein
VPERRGVEESGEGVETLSRLGLLVVEEIPVGSRHEEIIPVDPLSGIVDAPVVGTRVARRSTRRYRAPDE